MGVCAAALALAGACGDSSREADENDGSVDSATKDASAGTDASAGDAAVGGASDAGRDASGPADSAVTADGSVDAAGSDASDPADGAADSGPDISGLASGGDFAATRVTGVYMPGTADEVRPVSGFAFTDPRDITKVNVLKVMLTDFPITSCRVDMYDHWEEESVGKHILLCTVDPTWSPPLPGFYMDGNSYGWHGRASLDCYINLQDAGDVSGRVMGDLRLQKGSDQVLESTFDLVNCGRYDSNFF